MSDRWPRTPLPDPGPELSSHDVTYRLWRESDAPLLVRAWQDEQVATFTAVPSSATEEVARHWISGDQKRRARALALDVVLERQGAVVGEIGLSHFDASRRAALVGYWLFPEARGIGLASRALRSITDWSADALDVAWLMAVCSPANEPSIAVARRAGYNEVGRDAESNIVLAWHREDS